MAALAWDELTHAGAFLLGAIVATVATLRVVHTVALMLGGALRHRRPPSGGDDETSTDA